MFYSLTGKIVYSDQQSVAVQCGGVAYRCTVSFNTLKKAAGESGEVTLLTYLAVREDAVELFGFYDNAELEFFKMLISVSGVGPKVAIAVLSAHTTASLAIAISSGDVKSISRSQGVGAKTAQRIVLELKDKVARIAPTEISASEITNDYSVLSSGNVSEAVSALSALGFSQNEAVRALSGIDPALSVQELIKRGLKILSGG